MNATFLDENGKSQICEMGCYGIGVSRILASIAEVYGGERGVLWPASVAPFDVHLLLLEKEENLKALGEKLYADLKSARVDVLFDDRNERPGPKFADADLIGAPTRVVIGKTTKESGEVEIKIGDESTRVHPDAVVETILQQSRSNP